MSFKRLLAKSTDGKSHRSATLSGHLDDVRLSAQSIVDATGAQMLEALGLDPSAWLHRLRATVVLAAAIHDIGKANTHFQNAVQGRTTKADRQPIRHEWISVWIAMQPAVKAWLMPAVGNCESSWSVALFAVGGHHRKSIPTDACFEAESIEVDVQHEDFRASLQQSTAQQDFMKLFGCGY